MVIKYESENKFFLHKLLYGIIYTALAGSLLVVLWNYWNLEYNIIFFIILILIFLSLIFFLCPHRGNYTMIYDTENDRIDIFYDFMFFFRKHIILDTKSIKFYYEKLAMYYKKLAVYNLGEYNLCFFDSKNNVIISIPDYSMGEGLNGIKGKDKLDDFVAKLRENGVQERIVTKRKMGNDR